MILVYCVVLLLFKNGKKKSQSAKELSVFAADCKPSVLCVILPAAALAFRSIENLR